MLFAAGGRSYAKFEPFGEGLSGMAEPLRPSPGPPGPGHDRPRAQYANALAHGDPFPEIALAAEALGMGAVRG